MWYSFRYGSIHFCNIDTETDFPGAPLDEVGRVSSTLGEMGQGNSSPSKSCVQVAGKNGGFGDQLAWVEADLARAAADRASGLVTWILVGGHRPIYSRACTNADGVPQDDCKALQVCCRLLANGHCSLLFRLLALT
jgi:acid phosphatase type 7